MSISSSPSAAADPTSELDAALESDAGTPSTPEDRATGGRSVRDRDVLLLSAAVVIAVLGVQGLTILSPALNDAIGRPPTVIIFLAVVTIIVLVRVAIASLWRR